MSKALKTQKLLVYTKLCFVSSSPFLTLKCDNPHLRQFLKSTNSFLYKIQSLGHAWIFSYSINIRQSIFFASYIRSGSVLLLARISFNNWSNYVKLLSVHLFNTFKFINLNTIDNLMKLVSNNSHKGTPSLLCLLHYQHCVERTVKTLQPLSCNHHLYVVN